MAGIDSHIISYQFCIGKIQIDQKQISWLNLNIFLGVLFSQRISNNCAAARLNF